MSEAGPDVYDHEVEKLSKLSTDELYSLWANCKSPLFDFLTRGRKYPFEDNHFCGCPTMLVYDPTTATDYYNIRDRLLPLNIPKHPTRLTVSDLPKFAAAQRIADVCIPNRLPPQPSSH